MVQSNLYPPFLALAKKSADALNFLLVAKAPSIWGCGQQEKKQKTAGVTPLGIDRQKNKCDLNNLKYAIETTNGTTWEAIAYLGLS